MGGLRRTQLWVVAVTASALVAAGLGTAPAVWATERHGHNAVDAPDVKDGTAEPFKAGKFTKKDPTQAAAARTAAAVAKPATWPVASAATLPVAGRAALAKATSVGKLPVKVSAPAQGVAPGKVTVKVASHSTATALGLNGTVLSVARADGREGTAQTRLTLDYSGFANAYGGDYASRLTLVRLPSCAITTPALKKCRTTTPVATTNDVAHHTLTTTAPVSSSSITAFAATAAAASSGAGSYQATSLNPSAAWNAGGSSGDFTWSYPLSVPPPTAVPPRTWRSPTTRRASTADCRPPTTSRPGQARASTSPPPTSNAPTTPAMTTDRATRTTSAGRTTTPPSSSAASPAP